MNVPLRLGAFVAALTLAFGGAALAGGAINGDTTSAADPARSGGHGHAAEGGEGAGSRGGAAAPSAGAHGDEHGAASTDAAAGGAVGGLAVADGGYQLDVGTTTLPAGDRVPFAFRVTGPDGRVVRDGYELEHERELHFIVVRRDTAAFQHVHPRRDADGTWRTQLDLSEPGVYRAFADFKVGDEKRTLGIDLFVAGEFAPQRIASPSTRDSVDGLDVELKAPRLKAGRESTLTFAVTQDGQPFDGLQPYLGAKGHMVALREGDLAYLHVHPTEGGESHAHADGSKSEEAHANETAFAATFPTAGRYRVFLEFKTGGEVRRVSYTVEVPR